MLSVGARIKGWTVTAPLAQPDGWHELLAEDAHGGLVMLRIPPDLDGVAAIRLEADLAQQHTHESLVQTVGIVEHNGWPVQVLQHVDGLTLEQLVELTGTLTPAAVCRIGRQVALALVELHERAPVLCHGSLGPDRVIIDDGGNARLADVGIARPTSKKRTLSPERRRTWARPSEADDLWALGVILADALLGEARIVDDKLELPRTGVPERLGDALLVLVAPEGARMRNASAVVRMFTELELRLAKSQGDGAKALRSSMMSARHLARPAEALPRTKGVANDDVTRDDVEVTAPEPVATRPPAVERVPQSEDGDDPVTLRSEPKTVEMNGAGLDMNELRRLAGIAQDASTRGGAMSSREEVTQRVHRARAPSERAASERAAGERVASERARSERAPSERVPNARGNDEELGPDELAAVGSRQKLFAGVTLGLGGAALMVVLVVWLG